MDLDALDAYLSSESSPKDCMHLSDLDGFLTGIVVGPEPIKQNEWLPVIWGGVEPNFENDEEADLIPNTISGRYYQIEQLLASDLPEVDPIFRGTQDGILITRDWIAGFLQAMSLRPRQWAEMLNDEEGRLTLLPIISFVREDETGILYVDETDSLMRSLMEEAECIPFCVVEINTFWKARRRTTPQFAATLH